MIHDGGAGPQQAAAQSAPCARGGAQAAAHYFLSRGEEVGRADNQGGLCECQCWHDSPTPLTKLLNLRSPAGSAPPPCQRPTSPYPRLAPTPAPGRTGSLAAETRAAARRSALPLGAVARRRPPPLAPPRRLSRLPLARARRRRRPRLLHSHQEQRLAPRAGILQCKACHGNPRPRERSQPTST